MKKGDDKKMKNKFVLLRYIFMLWLLCGASCTLSIASAYDRTSPSASWGYQPLQSVRGASNYAVSYGEISSAVQPSYRFHTTSAYINSSNVGGSRILRSGEEMMRSGWGDPNDDEDTPIGTTPVTPIGDPLVLLFFALAFLGFRYYRRHNA